MRKTLIAALIIGFLGSCGEKNSPISENIISSDIDNFWEAYDQIISTQDSILQYKYLDSLYIRKGSPGLAAMMLARNYTAEDYLNAINEHPKFWTSVRQNTLKTSRFKEELNEGIEKIRAIYPSLKPAKMYFTIGALRSNGTTLDSLVLIGSELAMADENAVSDEFPEDQRAGRRTYFDSNPINDLVLLNVHEYVHTQQKKQVDNLLSYCLREGVAEFVSCKAMGVPSAAPAISYGKQNLEVRRKFEREMFYGHNVYEWLWSDFQNEFNVRDLGYHIGYEICELNYNNATDKQAAIKEMIELDYTNEAQIEDYIDRTQFFSKSIEELYHEFDASRPVVSKISQFENNSKNVNPNTKEITFEFSEALNGYTTSVDYGELGPDYFPKMLSERVWSDDNKTWTIPVLLEPNKKYQFFISNNFRTEAGIPLKSFLVEFETGE